MICASRTPKQFLLHVRTTIHMCKQMGLDMNFAHAEKAVTTAELDVELAKTEYAQICSSEKKKNMGSKSEGIIPDSDALTSTKANRQKTVKAIEATKLAVTMEGVKTFELYRNLISGEARQCGKNHQSTSDKHSLERCLWSH